MRALRSVREGGRLGLWLLAACLAPAGVAAQGADGDAESVRSRLILNVRPVTLTVEGGLEAADDLHRALLAAQGATDARVKIGRISGPSLLRVGTIGASVAEGDERPPAQRFDLWLTRDDASWVLEAERVARGDAQADPEAAGLVPLTHRALAGPRDVLAAALVPVSDQAGELVVQWGDHEWRADFGFAEPEGGGGGLQGGGDGSRAFDDDLSALSRAVTLAERNESAVVRADNAQISLFFWQEIGSDHADFSAIDTLEPGQVLRLTEAAVLKLRTEVALRFGDAVLPTDNLAPDFPGMYGLWLRRTDSGWQLLFNHEPDSWGTQYNGEYDAGSIDLTYARDGHSLRPLGGAIVPTSNDGGYLVIHWGPHQWAAEFAVGS